MTKKFYIQPLVETMSLFQSTAVCVAASAGFQVSGEDIQGDAR